MPELTRRLRELTDGGRSGGRLIRGGFGSAGIRFLNRLLTFALGIVLARGLGAEGYGIYAYAFAIMSLLMVLAEAGMPRLLLRETAAARARDDWPAFRGVLRRAWQIVAAVAIGIALVGLAVLATFWSGGDRGTLYTTGLMLLLLPAAALTRMTAYVMMGLHRVIVGKTTELLLRPVAALVFVSVGFFVWPWLREPHYAMAAQLVAGLTALLIGAALLRRVTPTSARGCPPAYRDREWLSSALPFMLIGGAGVINGHADMIMLGWFGQSEDVGIYRVAVQGAALVAFGLHAINPVIAPWFARLYQQADTERLQSLVTTSARVILFSALPVVIIFVVYGTIIVSWVFGSEYADADVPLAILSLAQLVNAGFGSVGLLMNMTGNENDSAKTMGLAASVNVVLNAVLIPSFGMTGAAVATATSLIVWNMILYRKVRAKLSISSTAFGVTG